MSLNRLENLLRNISFICIFSTMLFYWVKGGFFYTKKTTSLETIILIFCNFLLASILVVRWVISGHFPLSNLYESLIFLSWGLVTFLLYFQLKTKESFLGIILTPPILFITTFSTLSLPPEMQKASSLVPALQSNWLMMHVTIMMLSYAALISGSLLSLVFLIVTFFVPNKNQFDKNFKLQLSSNQFDSNSSSISLVNSVKEISSVSLNTENLITQLEREKKSFQDNIFLEKIDNLSYRIIGLGFPFLTIGILSGAVWANETWGSYWSWDPKETWALITWLIYAIYLHSRIIKKWKGKNPAIIASLGFLVVWVCYLGVNIFGKGLHSYGWFQN